MDYYEYDDMDSDDEGGSNDGFIDDTELGAIVDEGFRSKQTKVCILPCACTVEIPPPDVFCVRRTRVLRGSYLLASSLPLSYS